MIDQEVIRKTAEHLKNDFAGETSGHDWWHMYRVWKLAQSIANSEPSANRYVVELGALLHDVADWKFHNGDIEAGPRAAREWLSGLGVSDEIINDVEDIIRNVSFKGAKVASSMRTIEGKIVHDADKLDALGAIGIARTFAYGGSTGRPMYDPDIKPVVHETFDAYKKSISPSINHFYEKLLLLKDILYTDSAKKLAAKRHAYIESYLDEFFAEWEGKR